MMEKLIELDRDIFIYLNGLHAPWLDHLMYFMSNTLAWLPLHAFLLYLMVREYKKSTWFFVAGIVLTIILADQITTGVMKPFFERLRPTHDPFLEELVHTVNDYKGGKYGFASSHAANTFGAATFLFLTLSQTYPRVIWIFLWAAVVSYTRIYLGVHFPGDIIAGALVGSGCGWLSWHLSNLVYKRLAYTTIGSGKGK